MLKIIMLQKKRTAKAAELKKARSRRKQLRDAETELQQQVEDCEEVTEELEQQVDENANELATVEDNIAQLQDDIDALDQQIAELEPEEPAPAEEEETDANRGRAPPARRSAALAAPEGRGFQCRSRCFASRSQRDAFYARSSVKDFLTRVRGMLSQKGAPSRRAVTGAELTIPTDVLDVLRDNMTQYSKLIGKVRLRPLPGRARQQVIGEIPEAVWTEMSASLNELTFKITEVELDGYKIGGYVVIDNWMLEDSDIALGEEILYMLGQSLGKGLDKAILYGTGTKMPVGIATRLAQAAQPAYWGENQGDWTDLHESNVKMLNLDTKSGAEFFTPFLKALVVANVKYTDGQKFWVMTEATRTDLLIKALGIDAAAAIVAGMNNTMPIIGGEIITLEDIIPDKQVIGGALGDYLLTERAGGTFGYSDLPLYIQDKTVFKGTARYDGQPIHGEDFVAVSYDNKPVTTSMSFTEDKANAVAPAVNSGADT